MEILIVDDSLSIRNALKKLLRQLPDVKVSNEVSNVKDAIASLQNKHPDLMILDLKLENGSGFDILEYMKEIDHKIIVLVLSNFSSSQIKERCLQMGANYFFDKSTEFEKALQVIRDQL